MRVGALQDPGDLVGVDRLLVEQQLRQAEVAGESAGRSSGMTFTAPSGPDIARFLTVYNEVAERHARRASRFGIDGLRLFRYARVVATRAAATGSVECPGANE